MMQDHEDMLNDDPEILTLERTLVEFYPDPELRHRVHYAFAHQFLRWYASENPFAFFTGAMESGTRFIHSRWGIFEERWGLGEGYNMREERGKLVMTLKRVTDLEIWIEHDLGCVGVCVQMPPPEVMAEAFFVAVVATANPQALPRGHSTAGFRLIALERTCGHDGQILPLTSLAVLCEWASDKHVNSGMGVLPTREDFVRAVAQWLATPAPTRTPRNPGHGAVT